MDDIDAEEKPFMIVDKDTGRIYDIRNNLHVDRLVNKNSIKIGSQFV